ncbi:MAG: hypothetical protein P8L20_03175 [Flavobacteriales bacterium]|nr:hypothetical protein [Flavobacteriales bacterium]
MKRSTLKNIALTSIVSTGLLLGSCDLIKDLNYKVKENPLEMHGDEVDLQINATFVEKGLNAKAVVEVTPTFICKDGTEIPFEMVVYQGAKAAGNGTVIPKEGKTVVYNSTLPYNPCMQEGELVVKLVVKKGKKETVKEEITTEKIADGTIITPYLMEFDDKVIMANDEFVRTTEESINAVINYKKGKFNVNGSELKDQDIKDLEIFATDAAINIRREMKSVNVMSYASPEGEIDKNANLAGDRAASAAAYVSKLMKKLNFAPGMEEAFISKTPKGEDWDGFSAEVQKTTHEDKDLILRVLEMTQDPNKREQDIRNMAKTYKFLEKDVLPQLRRSMITLTYDQIGWSDEELTALTTTNPDTLTIEEVLFAATLTEDLNEKLRIYKIAEKNFVEDYRGANNVGYILYLQSDLDGAGAQFEKANGIEANPISINNIGAVTHVKAGNDKAGREKALELFTEAGTANETKYNMGLVKIQSADYADALANMDGNNTLNVAIAKIVSGDAVGALEVIDAAENNDSALAYYLKAIVGARTNNSDLVFSNLKTAMEKDADFKTKASKDREFVKYFLNADFKAMVD